jgi:hypothetical protein
MNLNNNTINKVYANKNNNKKGEKSNSFVSFIKKSDWLVLFAGASNSHSYLISIAFLANI